MAAVSAVSSGDPKPFNMGALAALDGELSPAAPRPSLLISDALAWCARCQPAAAIRTPPAPTATSVADQPQAPANRGVRAKPRTPPVGRGSKVERGESQVQDSAGA